MCENPTQPYVSQFRLSITKALADQLIATLENTDTAPLSPEMLERVQSRGGVYELFDASDTNLYRLYVGKAEKSLKARLAQHYRKLSGRQNIELATIRFKCVYVDEDLDATAPERMLIAKYRKTSTIPWNTNGFGNNDPGRNRDTSVVKELHFDALHPIDPDFVPLQNLSSIPSSLSVLDLLKKLKSASPFLIRFQDPSDNETARIDFDAASVVVTSETASRFDVDDWMREIISALPEGWQASILPGYIILYNEERSYPSARWYWRKSDGSTRRYLGDFALDNR